MTTETLTYTLGAGARTRAPRGRMFYLLAASAPVSFSVVGRPGQPVNLNNVSAGIQYGPVPVGEEWTYLEIHSASAQSITLIVSDDPVGFAGAVQIVGTATAVIAPSAAVSIPADVVLANAATHALAANLSRRRITVQSLASNTGNVRIAQTGAAGAARGLELQPGLLLEFATTAALDIYNGSGASQTLMIFEET